MSPRTRATFAKRQKEHSRQEKQRAKAERKLQRKLQGKEGAEDSNAEAVDSTETGSGDSASLDS
jgi:hypothetical protein